MGTAVGDIIRREINLARLNSSSASNVCHNRILTLIRSRPTWAGATREEYEELIDRIDQCYENLLRTGRRMIDRLQEIVDANPFIARQNAYHHLISSTLGGISAEVDWMRGYRAALVAIFRQKAEESIVRARNSVPEDCPNR